MIVVEQLNRAQWHCSFPRREASGVTNYVDALAYALTVACLYRLGVETVDLRGNRLVLMREEVGHG